MSEEENVNPEGAPAVDPAPEAPVEGAGETVPA